MNNKQIIMTSVFIETLMITATILLTPRLLNSSSASQAIDAILSLTAFILVIIRAAALSITFIIACSYLAKRLGYEMSTGLLFLVPFVNLVVFFIWAFRESSTERKLRRALKESP